MQSDLLEYSSIESLWIPPWFSGKESTCSAGDMDSISASGRSPGEENGNTLQYSCPENPMDRGTVDSISASGRCPGEENGNTFQYSCLENPMDRGTHGKLRAKELMLLNCGVEEDS